MLIRKETSFQNYCIYQDHKHSYKLNKHVHTGIMNISKNGSDHITEREAQIPTVTDKSLSQTRTEVLDIKLTDAYPVKVHLRKRLTLSRNSSKQPNHMNSQKFIFHSFATSLKQWLHSKKEPSMHLEREGKEAPYSVTCKILALQFGYFHFLCQPLFAIHFDLVGIYEYVSGLHSLFGGSFLVVVGLSHTQVSMFIRCSEANQVLAASSFPNPTTASGQRAHCAT